MQDNCLGLVAVSGNWMLSQSMSWEPSPFLSSGTESDTTDIMTRTEMVLETLAYSFFNHLLWLLTQENSTDMSNISLTHSNCHLADNASVSGKARFNSASIWLSLQQLLKPDRIVTCKCSLALWHLLDCGIGWLVHMWQAVSDLLNGTNVTLRNYALKSCI